MTFESPGCAPLDFDFYRQHLYNEIMTTRTIVNKIPLPGKMKELRTILNAMDLRSINKEVRTELQMRFAIVCSVRVNGSMPGFAPTGRSTATAGWALPDKAALQTQRRVPGTDPRRHDETAPERPRL